MQLTVRSNAKIAFITLLAFCLLFMFGCAERTVRALDYSLEDTLYEGEPEVAQTHEDVPDTTIPPEETAQYSVETPSPEVARNTPAPQETEQGAPTETPVLYRLIAFAQDESSAPLAGARVTLYQDGIVLFSGVSGSDGNVSWMLPPGHHYRVKVSLSCYQSGESEENDLTQDALLKITLIRGVDISCDAPAPTPQPVPEGAPGKVLISVPDVTIQPNQAGFSLLDGVSAKTEFGMPVAIWVVDNDGFAPATPGTYRVTYGAFEEGQLITEVRMIMIAGESEGRTAEQQAQAPAGSSKERYEMLLAYRKTMGEQLSERVAALNASYIEKVQQALAQNGEARILAPSDAEIDTDAATSADMGVRQTQDIRVTNWPDVIATFLARNVAEEDRPLDAQELANIPLDQLDAVFWDMNPIETFRVDGKANVLLSAKSYEDMAQAYNLSAKRKSFLYELMQPEFLRTFASITGSSVFSDTEFVSAEQQIVALPEETNVERKLVVETALSLVGKVSYVMGGKYSRLGWNDAWGNANEAEEGEPIQISQKKGLDCSGFVSWVFINATGDPKSAEVIGNGTRAQWKFSSAIGWDEGRPGDLAFYFAPGERQYNHVGIIVNRDADGRYLIAHCSSLQNGVVVTDGWSTGFRYLRRPSFFQ